MFCQGETTGKQAMRMLRRYPGEIRTKILNNLSAHTIIHLYFNAMVDDAKILASAQNDRFKTLCMVNEMMTEKPDTHEGFVDWIQFFIISLTRLCSAIEAHGVNAGRAPDDVTNDANLFVKVHQNLFHRAMHLTGHEKPIDFSLELRVPRAAKLRRMQKNEIDEEQIVMQKEEDLISMVISPNKSVELYAEEIETHTFKFTVKNSSTVAPFYYDGQTESVYYMRTDDAFIVYRKCLSDDSEPQPILETHIRGAHFIAVDEDHFYYVCDDAVQTHLRYLNLTTGKTTKLRLPSLIGDIINIYAIQDIVVIHHEYRVLIYRAKEQFVFIEEARGPVALLNPHCFAYTGFDAFGGLVVKVVRKHTEGPQLNILGFPSAFLNRYSNEILGVFWRGTQHLFLFEAGDREPCFIAMTSVGSFQPRGLYVKYGRC